MSGSHANQPQQVRSQTRRFDVGNLHSSPTQSNRRWKVGSGFAPPDQRARKLGHSGCLKLAVHNEQTQNTRSSSRPAPFPTSRHPSIPHSNGEKEKRSPKNHAQSSITCQTLINAVNLGQMHWLMYWQSRFHAVACNLGNATAVTCLLISALAVSVAILMILKMYTPTPDRFTFLVLPSSPLWHTSVNKYVLPQFAWSALSQIPLGSNASFFNPM
jgi:hypothetical protein